MVIEGSLALEVTEINDIVPALARAGRRQSAARVNQRGRDRRRACPWSAQLKLRLPPGKVEEVRRVPRGARRHHEARTSARPTSASRCSIRSSRIANLKTTLARGLTELMAKTDLQVAQILQIEQEDGTRIRGADSSSSRATSAFLQDSRRARDARGGRSRAARGAVTVAKGKALSRRGARRDADAARSGPVASARGSAVASCSRRFLRSLSFEGRRVRRTRRRSRPRAAPIYSDFLGGGKRRHAETRTSACASVYGYLDTSRFVVQGEVGVEPVQGPGMSCSTRTSRANRPSSATTSDLGHRQPGSEPR